MGWSARFTMSAWTSARDLSPLPGACGILRVPLPATGRGWAHSPSSWQRAAPGRRAEWLEIREARCDRCRRGAQQWSLCAVTALRAQGVNASSGQPDAAGSQSIAAAPKIAGRGCRKATQGPEQGLREPDGVPREARNQRLPGRVVPAPGLPTRHPRTRRTPGPSCPGTDGAWAESAVRTRRSSTCNAGCAVNPPSARCGTRSPGAARAGAGTGPARRRDPGCGSPCGIRTAGPRRSAASADWRWKSRDCR